MLSLSIVKLYNNIREQKDAEQRIYRKLSNMLDERFDTLLKGLALSIVKDNSSNIKSKKRNEVKEIKEIKENGEKND